MDISLNLEKVGKAIEKGAFLSSARGSEKNTMTISWGFIGRMWNKPYFVALVRPNRHSFDIIKETGNFTVSVPFGAMDKELAICGTKSGVNFDKSTVVKFGEAKKVGSPIILGCDMFYECVVDYIQAMDKSALPTEIVEKFYTDPIHYFFYGEIVDAYAS